MEITLPHFYSRGPNFSTSRCARGSHVFAYPPPPPGGDIIKRGRFSGQAFSLSLIVVVFTPTLYSNAVVIIEFYSAILSSLLDVRLRVSVINVQQPLCCAAIVCRSSLSALLSSIERNLLHLSLFESLLLIVVATTWLAC